MAVETIYVHKLRNSQLVGAGYEPFSCEICNRKVRPGEIQEVDNSPNPSAG